MTTEETTLADLADEVLASLPDGSKYDWGQELARLARVNDLYALLNARLNTSLGNFVSSRKAAAAKAAQQEKLARIGYSGQVLSPVLSVRKSDGSRQMDLWTEVEPDVFAEAVFREQNVIDGRQRSNAIRLRLAKQIVADDGLMDLPNLKEVCNELDIDPDTLGLEELEVNAS